MEKVQSQPYTWTTIAGSPLQLGSNDGTNSQARFGHFLGIATDSEGAVFVADTQNRVIRKIDHLGTDWVVTTLAGGDASQGLVGPDGTNRDAWFTPCGVTVDAFGTLYVADGSQAAVRKIAPVGTNWVVTTLAGAFYVHGTNDGVGSQARFEFLTGIAVDAATNLFVADCGNHTIRKLTPQGTNWLVTTIAGFPGTNGTADGTNDSARFYNPYNLVLDSSGNIFVADTYNATIRKISPIGTNWVVTTIAGQARSYGYVDGWGQAARFCGIGGIAIDDKGRLYVAESCNYTIRKLTPVGTNWLVTTLGGLPGVSGAQDGTGSDARFYPWNITVDQTGALYVADEWNYTVRRGQIAMVLRSAFATNHFLVSWPVVFSNCVLETTAEMKTGATWMPLTNGIGTFADDFVLTNATDGAAAFFRLRQL